MKKKIILAAAILIALLAAALIVKKAAFQDQKNKYSFVEVTRGDLEETISASGTISPVTTVEIGTQVSGTIEKVFVDYNDKVEKGQLLAVLETSLLESSVNDAAAALELAQAQLEEAQAEYDRNQPLYEKGYVSESEFLPISINLKTKKAGLKSAAAGMRRAKQNLEYAYIRSPINGTVISRNVEAGQTVAASFNTPTLFEIAEDLSRIEIIVEVDESDIGLVREGQKVRFEVQAYSEKMFDGEVKQIRLQPVTVSNVVNYMVVVEASNRENLLLPGMTAEVDFIIRQSFDVLTVPNTALKFKPTDEMIASLQKTMDEERKSPPDHLGEKKGQEPGKPPGPPPQEPPDDLGRLWYMDETGKLRMAHVKTGMTDGIKTEISAGGNITEGMKVIQGFSKSSSEKDKESGFSMPPPPGGMHRM